jgi:hypothetical protein
MNGFKYVRFEIIIHSNSKIDVLKNYAMTYITAKATLIATYLGKMTVNVTNKFAM